ncbi:C1 family peptidase [Brevibacillus fortis]|uniref:C1 family peptidase n=1 Tax=Brevibacillus fortis TaxID=2126352 RepID=UPI002E2063AA|nr:C1 family peptidase [Brevibacillus fortis]
MKDNMMLKGTGVIPLTPEMEKELNRKGKLLHGKFKENLIAPLVAVSQIDLSPQFPPVRDQGPFETCVAFATAAILDYWDGVLSGRGANTMVRSPLHMYYDKKADSGMVITAAFDNADKRGCCAEVERPYSKSDESQFSKPITKKQEMSGLFAKNNVSPIIKPFSQNTKEDKIAELKELLSRGIPILVSIDTLPSFRNPDANGIITPKPGESGGGHAIVLVGFDDQTGLFKFRNSWGTDYGIGGYGYVRYMDIFAYSYNGFYFFTSTNYRPYIPGNNLVTPFYAPSDSSVVSLGEGLKKYQYRFIKFAATRSGVHTFKANYNNTLLAVMSEDYATTITKQTAQQVKATLSAGQTVYIEVYNNASLTRNDGAVTFSLGN